MFSKRKFFFKAPSQYLQPIILIFLGLLSLLMLRPHTIGVWGDDTTYLIAAKALATGQGYHLISAPSAPALAKYPPLFPLVLSGFWRIFPLFPAMILFYKLLNLALSLFALNILYLLARRSFNFPRSVAAVLCLFVGSNATWLSVNLEVLSEPLYLVLTLGALYLAQSRSMQPQSSQSDLSPISEARAKPDYRLWVTLIALSVLAFYTRTIAIILMVAMGLWLGQRYGKRAGLIYGGSCLLLCLGWVLWSTQGQAPILHTGNFYVYHYNQSYFREWWLNSIGRQGLWALLSGAVQELPKALLTILLPLNLHWPPPATIEGAGAKQASNLFIHGLLLSSGLLLGFFAGLRWIATIPAKFHLLLYYVFFYMVALLAWPSQDQYARLLVCIFPVLALLLFQLFHHRRGTILAIALTMLSLASNLITLQPVEGNRKTLSSTMSLELWDDYQATFKAIREKSPADAIFWARPDGLLFLNTGRRAINFQITPSPAYFQAAPADNVRQLLAITGEQLQKSGARYILLEPYFMAQQPVDELIVDWIRRHRDRFKKVYTSPHRHLFVYRVL